MPENDIIQAAATALAFRPKRVTEPTGWVPHTPCAAALVRTLRPGIIVELGTHTGNSYFAFCQAVEEFHILADCYAVDTWKGDFQAGIYDESVYRQVCDYNQANYSKFSRLMRMTFDEAASRFSDESIDILHIDGLHTYEAVKHDFETWLPKVRDGGVILFHDICARHGRFGVWRLWSEIKQTHPHTLTLLHSHGLGVMVKAEPGGAAGAFLRQLTEKSFETFWQGLFSKSGDYVLYKSHAKPDMAMHAQVYISEDGNYAEEKSVRISYAPNTPALLRFSLENHISSNGPVHLRLDPVARISDVQINRISLLRDSGGSRQDILKDYDLSKEIKLDGATIRFGDDPLRLLARTEDPQLYLPSFEWDGSAPCVLEVEIQADPALGNVAGWVADQARTLETLRATASQVGILQSRVQVLEEEERVLKNKNEEMGLAIEQKNQQMAAKEQLIADTRMKAEKALSEIELQLHRSRSSLIRQREHIHAMRASGPGQCVEILKTFCKPTTNHKKVHFHIDVKPPGFWVENPFILAGWFADENIQPAAQLRVTIGTRLILCHPTPRPDVCRHFSFSDDSLLFGFHQQIKTGAGLKLIIMEAETQAGEIIEIYRGFHFLRKPLAQSKGLRKYDYGTWLLENDRINPPLPPPGKGPLISVVMPVYNAPEKWLGKAIESVINQTYGNWELCVVDDASSAPHVRRILEEYQRMDGRIKVKFRDTNGHISAATNSAIAMCKGEFIALLDHDDEFSKDALSEVVYAINENPKVCLIYSDEDKIDEHGRRFDPHFKPDWNPDFLTSLNYVNHLCVYRASLLREAGGFRIGVEGSQDWDMLLRATKGLGQGEVMHLPKILYHWRAIPGSTAASLASKPYHMESSRKVLQDYFTDRGEDVRLEPAEGSHWRVRRLLQSDPHVTLIVPTRNRVELLKITLESILSLTSYANYDILIADNDSDEADVISYFEELKNKYPEKITILSCPGPFNFSKIVNQAVRAARGEVVGLVNNDVKVINGDWLEEMVSHAIRLEIGCVGAKLYYPNETLQHAGVILGLGGVAGHAFKHFPRSHPGNAQHRPHVAHNVSAVTAACLVVRKQVYLEAGGFDEDSLTVAFNDVDFCLKVRAAGYRNLFTPFAELWHYESASRGLEDKPEKVRRFQGEIKIMQERWGDILGNDPAYNRNLTLDREDFSLAMPPRKL